MLLNVTVEVTSSDIFAMRSDCLQHQENKFNFLNMVQSQLVIIRLLSLTLFWSLRLCGKELVKFGCITVALVDKVLRNSHHTLLDYG